MRCRRPTWTSRNTPTSPRSRKRPSSTRIFFQDTVGVAGSRALARGERTRAKLSRTVKLEPTATLAALAMVTSRIGLVATATTTYNEPYNIARRFASIDHISGGRAGWNLVTSQIEDELENFGFDEHLAHAERYERAAEFYEVVTGLWDSWEDGGLLRDKQSGVYMDRDKVHFLDHVGKHFKVKGPLNITPLAAGLAGGGAGGLVRGRPRARRTHRRRGVHRPDEDRRGEGLLRRHQEPRGALRPRTRRHQDHAGPHAGARPHHGRSARELRIPAVADARRRGAAVAVAHLGRPRPCQVPARRAAARAAAQQCRQGAPGAGGATPRARAT